MQQLIAKSQEYVAFDVRVALIADPYARRVYLVTDTGAQEIEDRIATFPVGNPTVEIDLNLLFARLDLK